MHPSRSSIRFFQVRLKASLPSPDGSFAGCRTTHGACKAELTCLHHSITSTRTLRTAGFIADRPSIDTPRAFVQACFHPSIDGLAWDSRCGLVDAHVCRTTGPCEHVTSHHLDPRGRVRAKSPSYPKRDGSRTSSCVPAISKRCNGDVPPYGSLRSSRCNAGSGVSREKPGGTATCRIQRASDAPPGKAHRDWGDPSTSSGFLGTSERGALDQGGKNRGDWVEQHIRVGRMKEYGNVRSRSAIQRAREER